MKAISIREARGQLGRLDLEEDSPELEAELLKAVNGPHKPFHESELREIADRALREHRAREQKQGPI